jgi:error-prone DNA polymerase
MSLPDYAELHCLSNFSFLRGASHPEELVERAVAQGYDALALTDECSLAGVVRAHRAAKAAGLKFIVGSEMTTTDGLKLVFLAGNRHGYGNLSALITLARRRAEKGAYALQRNDLEAVSPSGAVPDCLVLWVPGELPVVEDGRWLAGRFPGRCWIAVELHAGPDDAAKLAGLQALGAACGLPLVAAGDVHMHVKARRPVQDVLAALRLKTTVFDAGYALFPNGERHLRSRLRLSRLHPPELLAETLNIAARCEFSLDELRYEYPEEIVPAGETPASWLRVETERGLARRYPAGVPDSVRQRIEHELALIAEMAYEAYFLTVYDIVCFARSQDILCQGRGSAANSAVCYALGVTEVDPARSSLLFERFISKERGEPPDIDVDFEHERREEVIQYIYRKYGRERAALAAALITYRTKGALRDAGRALGFGIAQINALTASLAWWDKRDALPERFAELGLDPRAPRVEKWLVIAEALRGFPRHLTQHVGGFVISRGPLARLVPVENAAMAERSVIQWDKDDLDAMGLMKVDILALGMLTAIRRTLSILAEISPPRGLPSGRGRPWHLRDIPAEDPATYEMLCHADSMGVFQVESRAQMAMLPRLRPKNFYDLVVEVALVRPGPIQGDMVHPYLKRRQGRERIEKISPAVDKVLERTFGVPIFQEQVMQLAVVAANFTPGEADQLRRAMAAWKRKGGLEPFEHKLRAGMAGNGLPAAFAERIILQIQGFGEYGFPESHAASFALLVYASAWLKRHHPAAFLCGLLNSQPMGFYSPSLLIQDARRRANCYGPPKKQAIFKCRRSGCPGWAATPRSRPARRG